MARPLCVRLYAGPSSATLARRILRDEPPLRRQTYGLQALRAGRGWAEDRGPRGPEPGYGRFLDADQEAETRDLIRRHTPDELGLPFALCSRAAVRELIWR